jgi:hypothetical protein
MFVKLQWLDGNGDPYAAALLFTYLAGTTTKVNTFTDQALTTPNANPIVLDSAGQAVIYLDPSLGSVKYVLAPSTDTDPPASPIWTADNLAPVPFYTISTTITPGTATAAAWSTSDNVQSLVVPRHPTVISCIFDTPTDAINIPAGTLGANDDCIICEWETTYSSATLSARCTAFGTNIDLGSGSASTVTMARCILHRQVVGTVHYNIEVNQGGGNVANAQGDITSLNLDNTAYTIELTMASGSFDLEGHRILFIPALTDWTA